MITKAALIKNTSAILVKLGERGLAAVWCSAFSLALLLLFTLTVGVRRARLQNEVNDILRKAEKNITLEAPISPWGMSGAAMQTGEWYISAQNRAPTCVFSVVRTGVLVPFLAVPSQDAQIEIVPLNANAEAVYKKLQKSTLDVYKRRIQKAGEAISASLAAKNAKQRGRS